MFMVLCSPWPTFLWNHQTSRDSDSSYKPPPPKKDKKTNILVLVSAHIKRLSVFCMRYFYHILCGAPSGPASNILSYSEKSSSLDEDYFYNNRRQSLTIEIVSVLY